MPNERVLRDKVGTRLGVMIDTGNEVVARDRYGNRVGHFDKTTGTTRNKFGTKLTEGNILAALIVGDQKPG